MTPPDVPPSPTASAGSDGHPSSSTTHSESTGPLLPDELHTVSSDESPSDWSASDQSDRSEDEDEDDQAGFDMVSSREFHPASEGGRSSLSTGSRGSSSESSGQKSADERMKLSYPDPLSSVEFAPLSPAPSPPPSPTLPAEKSEAKEIKDDLENSILHDGGTYSLLLDAPVPSSPSFVAPLPVAASTIEPPYRGSETNIASSATLASPLLRAETNNNGPETVVSALASTKYDAETIGKWVRLTSVGSEKKLSPSTSPEASQADQQPASVTSSQATVVPAAFPSVLSISPSEKKAAVPMPTADSAIEVEANENAVAAVLQTKPKPAPASRSTIPDKLDEIAFAAGRKSLMSRTMIILTAAALALAAAGMMEATSTLSALMHGHVAVTDTTDRQIVTQLAVVTPEIVTYTVTTVTSYAASSDASTSSLASATSSTTATTSDSSSNEREPSSSTGLADQPISSSSPAPSACAPCPPCDIAVLSSPSPIFAPRPRPNRRSAGVSGARPRPFHACRGSGSEQQQEEGRTTLTTHPQVNKHDFSPSTDTDHAVFDRAFDEALRTISSASKDASRRIQKHAEEILDKVSRLYPPTVLALHGAHERVSMLHGQVRQSTEMFLLHSHHGKHELDRARRAAEGLATSLRRNSARIRNRSLGIAEESARSLASQLGLAKARFAKGAPAMQQRAREAAQGLLGFGSKHVRRAARTTRKLARRAERGKAKRDGKKERAGRGELSRPRRLSFEILTS
ncbi:hypothetical protein JCM1841_006675 [Sporobolomyces salmonicolor]